MVPVSWFSVSENGDGAVFGQAPTQHDERRGARPGVCAEEMPLTLSDGGRGRACIITSSGRCLICTLHASASFCPPNQRARPRTSPHYARPAPQRPPSSPPQKMSVEPRSVVFFHPDLGIGGAERLVVDAAVGLQDLGHKVTIFTSHCDPKHCFDEARDGKLTCPPSCMQAHSYHQSQV